MLSEKELNEKYYCSCSLCPRECKTDRLTNIGLCSCTSTLKAARAGLHYYEEPFLSGRNGSGTVFFSGCSLGCIYCQNGQISRGNFGIEISIDRLSDIFIEQQGRGAHNINLVTGTHYTPSIAVAIEKAKIKGLSIPVIWNSSGYEKSDTLKSLDGLIDIWLPDFKTLSPDLGMKYMHAPDYPQYAKAALKCMVQMSGTACFASYEEGLKKTLSQFGTTDISPYTDDQDFLEGENVLMTSGVVVRHMVVPDQVQDSKNVIKYLYETYGDNVWISIMSQYTPVGVFANMNKAGFTDTHPELFKTVTQDEYDEIVDFAIDLGVENCMIQDGETASDSFIPIFDGSGITPDQ